MHKILPLINNDNAVSEVLGGILLVLIGVAIFGLIYLTVFPLQLPETETNIEIGAFIDENGNPVLEHLGGEPLTEFEIYADGTLIYENSDGNIWDIGEICQPEIGQKLISEEDTALVTVYSIDDGKRQVIFNGYLQGNTDPQELIFPMLISSLRTDSIDEDLICYNYSMNYSVNATSFIYNFIVNGESFAELYLPFDTQSVDTAKDYTGNGYDGSVVGPQWTDQGKVGGAYYFSGSSDYIETDLPSILTDVSNNDFTISLWIKSDDITDDQRVSWEGGVHKNFAKMFQFGSELHFGICYNDGTQDSVRTENLSSNTWYHIVGVWDASEKAILIYTNGLVSSKAGNRSFSQGAQDGFAIGHGTSSSRFWYGYIDEVKLFDRVLSDDQIYQLYMDEKDGFSDRRVISAQETILGDVWQCIVTPNDGTQDEPPSESNTLEIQIYNGG